MILQSDDTLRIPVGYLQLKQSNGAGLGSIEIGLLALIFQFKGLYRTSLPDLIKSFNAQETQVIHSIEYLKKCGLIKLEIINDTFILTHGNQFEDIHKNAYEKRDLFAKNKKGSL